MSPRRRSGYRTGDDALDERIRELITEAGGSADDDLIFEMVVSALRMGREEVDRGELKIASAALKELRYAFHVFAPYQGTRKVAIFGSARTVADDPGYRCTQRFAGAIAEEGWMVLTGAGPGIMAAGIEGAGADRSFGVNIVLPFEAEPAPVIAGDPKLINFRYFFTRKLTFVKEADAFVLLPGGFGTMDEAFELLTLVQTGRAEPAPIVLLEPEGSSYWETWESFVREELLSNGMISEGDLCLVRITDDIGAAVEEITSFYATYHSLRYVGGRLVLRLHREVGDDELASLNTDFADIVSSGRIERVGAHDREIADRDAVELPRLAFRFDQERFDRLRQLIDALNRAP